MGSVDNTELQAQAIRNRYINLVQVYETFLKGVDEAYRQSIMLSKPLLHIAVKSYFDDIDKYKLYAGSTYADRHKQAAYTMQWIARFKPIQIKENVSLSPFHLTVNEAFAIFAGLIFLDPSVAQYMTEDFYHHLIYTLAYRNIEGKGLATMLYLVEKLAQARTSF